MYNLKVYEMQHRLNLHALNNYTLVSRIDVSSLIRCSNINCDNTDDQKELFHCVLTDVCGRWEKRYSELLQNGERAWVFKQRMEIGDAEVKTRDANYLTGD